MTNRALFDVDADGEDQGFEATNAQVLTFTLRSTIGVRVWELQVFDDAAFSAEDPISRNPPRASPDAPELTLIGATSGQRVSPATVGGSITSTMPATGTHAWLVRSIVNGGIGPSGSADPSLIHERLVTLRDENDLRPIIATETTQHNDDGWARAIDEMRQAIAAAGGGLGPKATVYSVTLAAGLHSNYALPSGFESGDILMVQLLGDAAIDGIAAPATNNFLVRFVFWDSSGGLWRVEFRDSENSVSTAGNLLRTPGEGSFEGPPLVLGPSEEESATWTYSDTGSSSSWRCLGSTWRAHPRKFDNTHTPVARYDLDSAVVLDSSGNGFALSGSPTIRSLSPGIIGAVSATMSRGANDAALTILGDVTLQAICVMRAVPAAAYIIAFQAAGETEAANYAYSLRFDDQNTLAFFSESGAGVNSDFTATGSDGRSLPALGVPFHVAATRISNVVRFYINGEQYGSASGTLTAPTGATSSTLKLRDSGTNIPELAAVKVIASGLTAAQIRAEYNRTIGGAHGFV